MILSLRFYISLLIGLSVLAVAAVVIVIVSTLYSDAANNLGVSYARALGFGSKSQVESYMITAYEFAASVPAILLSSGHSKLPRDDPTVDAPTMCPTFVGLMRASSGTLLQIAILLDDGSVIALDPDVIPGNQTPVFRCSVFNTWSVPSTTHGTLTEMAVDAETGFQYNFSALFQPSFAAPLPASGLPAAYTNGKASALTIAAAYPGKSFFVPATAGKARVTAKSQIVFPVLRGVYNASRTFLGLIGGTISTISFADLLKEEIKYFTKGSHVFIIAASPILIVASSHPAPTTNTSVNATVSPGLPGNGCFNTQNARRLPIGDIVCPITPGNFSFPPIRKLAALKPTAFTDPKNFEMRFDAVDDSDGKTKPYFVINSVLSNPGVLFGMQAVFFINFDEVESQIMEARNVVIGVGIGILLFGVIVSTVVVAIVLQPLRDVAAKMNATSRLKLSDQDNTLTSRIAEIHMLQVSYVKMHGAMTGFTKYLPRDIVKSLLHEKFDDVNNPKKALLHTMSQRNVTFFVSDLAGFTSLCERQDPKELSRVLEVYFDRMSSTLMEHDMTIVQFQGDAILSCIGALPGRNSEFQEIKACIAALMCQREACLEDMLDTFDSIGETVAVRIGLSSGPALCGTIGSSSRVTFSVFGTTVDFANTLEGMNKKYRTKILASASVAEAVNTLVLTRCASTPFVDRQALLTMQTNHQKSPLLYEIVGLFPPSTVNLTPFMSKEQRKISTTNQRRNSLGSRSLSGGEVNNNSLSLQDSHQTLNASDQQNEQSGTQTISYGLGISSTDEENNSFGLSSGATGGASQEYREMKDIGHLTSPTQQAAYHLRMQKKKGSKKGLTSVADLFVAATSTENQQKQCIVASGVEIEFCVSVTQLITAEFRKQNGEVSSTPINAALRRADSSPAPMKRENSLEPSAAAALNKTVPAQTATNSSEFSPTNSNIALSSDKKDLQNQLYELLTTRFSVFHVGENDYGGSTTEEDRRKRNEWHSQVGEQRCENSFMQVSIKDYV